MNGIGNSSKQSTLRVATAAFSRVLLVIFVCEAAIHTLLVYVLASETLWNVIIDPILVAALGTPLLYRFVVRPIRTALEERRLAEERLRESEERFRAMVEVTSDWVWEVDENGAYTYVSPKVGDLLGYEPEEVLGKKPFEFMPAEESERVSAEYQPLVDSRQPLEGLENTNLRKDGRLVILETSGVPLFDSEGNFAGYRGIDRDITERVRAEEERANLAKFPSENPSPVVRIGAAGAVLYANEAAEPLLVARGSAVGAPAPEEWRELAGDVLASGKRRVIEAEHGGRIFSFSVVPVPEIGYVNLYGTDITERRRAQHLLETFAESVVEGVPAMVITLDQHGRIQRFNKFARELTGYSLEEAQGTCWIETFSAPEHQEGLTDSLQRVLEGAVVQGYENPIVTKDGRKVLIRLYGAPLRDDRGDIVACVIIGIDITELRQKEEQLRQAAKMEAIGRLAGGVAHDFNNYLTAIRGYAGLLLKDLPAEDPSRGSLEEVSKAADRAAQLTKELLTLGRRAILKPRVIDLNRLLGDIADPLTRMIGEDIQLAVSQGADPANIKGDLGQIRQVIMNLAINARDAMPEGGRLTIETANVEHDAATVEKYPGALPGHHVMLIVSDTGTGMDEEIRRHVFEPFFTTKPNGAGAGLGLATVHGIVQQSRGHITVESEPGRGTTFRICFPCVEAPEEAPAEAAVAPAPPEPARAETILVVEDEGPVRRFLVKALELSGYTILAARSPSEALSVVRDYQGPIHLAVTDVIMPEMSGPELVKELEDLRPGIPILYISGYTKDALSMRNTLRPETRLLTKPFGPEELRRTVGQALEDSQRPEAKDKEKEDEQTDC